MHAYLIIGDRESVHTKLQEKVIEIGAKKYNYAVKKIADLRELQKFTKLALSEKTAVIIDDFDEVGEEAQNAFLKSLEEPQVNLFYILTAINLESVLPTVVSRCEVCEAGVRNQVSEDERKIVEAFFEMETGERMRTISSITKRDAAVEFMEKIIVAGHELFLNDEELSSILQEAGRTFKAIKANGNVQLQLTNFVVNCDWYHAKN